jgi:hypothetical protein
MPKVGHYLHLGSISLIELIRRTYNLLPNRTRNFIQTTELNFILYCIYSFLISKFRKFFSQTGEDKLISKYLPEMKGKYIDIGSGQPVRGSNTYFLYKKGWSGHLIDPLRFNLRLSKIFRKRDIKMEGLVSSQTEVLKFYEFYPGEYSTTVSEVADNLIKRNIKLKNVYELKGFPLSSLQISMTPFEPTLISIDVEGLDFDVLKSNDWEKITPRVICVEDTSPVSSESDISIYLNSKGYIFTDSTGISSIYVHSTYKVER